MTLILGIEDEQQGCAFLFSDSGVWRGSNAYAALTERKLWKSDGWLAGASGDWAMAQAARRVALPPLGSNATEAEVVNSLFEWQAVVYARCGEVSELIHKVDSTKTCDTPSIIVARGPWVFRLSDMSVTRVTRGFDAVGMWMYAYGAVASARRAGRTPFDSAANAYQAVGDVTDGILGPVHWTSTDGREATFPLT